MIDMESDAAPSAQAEAITRIARLAELLKHHEHRVELAEWELKDAKQTLLKTAREDLPELMRECGLKKVVLTDGSTVELRDDVQCGISQDRKSAAFNWLADHDFDGIIKTDIVMTFTRAQRAEALALRTEIETTYGVQTDLVESVHPQTLRAFVRERLAAGDNLPMDDFGVRPFTEAKVKPPKD